MDFESRLEPVYGDAVRLSRALAGSASDGDDILQDALVKAWKGYPRLKDPACFRPWLLKIVGNTWRSWLRRKKLRSWVSLEFIRNMPTRPEAELENLENRDLLRLALQNLPAVQREALVLFELTGAGLQEVAEIQGVSLSAVKSRLARGRQRLRKQVRRITGEGTRHV